MRRVETAAQMLNRLDREAEGLRALVASRAAHSHEGPRGVLGYAPVLAGQTGISSVTDLTGLSVTVDVAANRSIRITGQVRVIQRTSASNCVGSIREGTTYINRWADETLAVNERALGHGAAIITPSAGSHTYKLSLETTAGTVDTLASSTTAAFILVEDIGAG